MSSASGQRWQRWATYVLGGALNTSVTYAIYLLLRLAINYQAAYFVAYVLGILFSYYFNARFVFRTPLSLRGLFAYPIVYLMQYLISAGLLGVLVEHLALSSTYAPLLITVIMIPLTYSVSKLVLMLTHRGAPPGSTSP